MKKYVTIFILVLSTIYAKAQNPSYEVDTTATVLNIASPLVQNHDINEAYKNTPEWGKYKSLRTVGWTLFGVGLGTGAGGIITAGVISILSDNSPAPGWAIAGVGAGLTVASIPILVTAYHYRGKAKKIGMSLGMSPLYVPQIGNQWSSTPGINFAITF